MNIKRLLAAALIGATAALTPYVFAPAAYAQPIVGNQQITILENGSATSTAINWPGGGGMLFAEGTWSGATATLSLQSPNGTWINTTTTFTANGSTLFAAPRGPLRMTITGGPPSALYIYAIARSDMNAGSGGTSSSSGGLTDAQLRATAVPVSGTVTATPTGTQAVSAASGTIASGALAAGSVASGAMVDLGAIADATATAGSTGTLSAKLRLMTTQLATLDTSINASNSELGAVTETAPTTDTASSGLNGRLQRLAQKWVAQASTTSGQTGLLMQGAVTTSAPSYTTAQTSPLSLDTAGALRVTGATAGTQYTEDVAAAADPVGNMGMAVRRDTLSATTVSANGDNIALGADANGQLRVTQADGTSIPSVTFSAAGATATVTTAIASPGVVAHTSHGLATGTPYIITGGTQPAELQTPAVGATFYVIADIDANNFHLARTPELAAAGTAINFTGTSSGTQTGTRLLAFATLNMTGYKALAFQLVTFGGGAFGMETSEDAQTWVAQRCTNVALLGGSTTVVTTASAAIGLRCDKAFTYSRPRVTTYTSGTYIGLGHLSQTPNGGEVTSAYSPQTNAVQGAVSQAAAVATTTLMPPITIDARSTPAPTAVATGQTARVTGTLDGKPYNYPWGSPDFTWQYASTSDVTDTTSTEMVAALASNRRYVNNCVFSNTDATVGTYVNILSASTVIGVVYVAPQTAATAGQNSLPSPFPIPLRGAVNEAINFQAVTTSAQLRVMCQGFTSVQ